MDESEWMRPYRLLFGLYDYRIEITQKMTYF